MGYTPDFRCYPVQYIELIEDTLISHCSASLETPPKIDNSSAKQNKMKELKFSEFNALFSLALLQPKPDCVIIKKEVESISGNVIFTARGNKIFYSFFLSFLIVVYNFFYFILVTIGGVHYEGVYKSEYYAKQKAAFKAISNLSDGMYIYTSNSILKWRDKFFFF